MPSVGDRKGVHRDLVRRPEGKRPFVDLGVEGVFFFL